MMDLRMIWGGKRPEKLTIDAHEPLSASDRQTLSRFGHIWSEMKKRGVLSIESFPIPDMPGHHFLSYSLSAAKIERQTAEPLSSEGRRCHIITEIPGEAWRLEAPGLNVYARLDVNNEAFFVRFDKGDAAILKALADIIVIDGGRPVPPASPRVPQSPFVA